MANQLILQQQKFKLADITSEFPATGSVKKKVFFQTELRSLTNGDATFGVIAYASWKDGNRWVVGKKIAGIDTGTPVILPFTPPLAFANNEVILAVKAAKKKKKKKDPRKGRWNNLLKAIRKTCKDKKVPEKAFILFNAGISENPHLEYDVTFDLGNGNSLKAATKPSPPAPPEA